MDSEFMNVFMLTKHIFTNINLELFFLFYLSIAKYVFTLKVLRINIAI